MPASESFQKWGVPRHGSSLDRFGDVLADGYGSVAETSLFGSEKQPLCPVGGYRQKYPWFRGIPFPSPAKPYATTNSPPTECHEMGCGMPPIPWPKK